MRPNLNPLHTSFHPPSSSSYPSAPPRPQDHPSPTRSPTSPTTTASISSPSPPTSPFPLVSNHPRPRRLHQNPYSRGRLPTRDPPHPHYNNNNHHQHHHHNLSSYANATPNGYYGSSASASASPSGSPSPNSPFRLSASASSLFSARPSTILLRRRPSRTELALREERYRAEEDRFERLGLEMLEPRPVAAVSAASATALGFEDDAFELGSMDGAVEGDSSASWDLFGGFGMRGGGYGGGGGGGAGQGRGVVMEGIFEVLEG